LEVDFFDVDLRVVFFDDDFFVVLFCEVDFFDDEAFFDEDEAFFDDDAAFFDDDDAFFDEPPFEDDDFFDGTLPPSRRASDRPMAMACLRLVTFFPEPPLFSVPRLRSCIALSTFSEAFFPYLLAIQTSCTEVCASSGPGRSVTPR
jgi:hypothetical protein